MRRKLKGDSFYNRDKTERQCRLATHRPFPLRRCTLRRDSVVGLAVGGRREALGGRLYHSPKMEQVRLPGERSRLLPGEGRSQGLPQGSSP